MPKYFMMAFVRKKKVKGYTYYYIVKGVYDKKGKLSQKVVKYLGTANKIYEKILRLEEFEGKK